MAAHTPLPRHLRRSLAAFSGSLFINNKTRDSGAAHTYHPAHEVLASLPLQMMLYFNVYYFPVWCLAEGIMLQLKYHLLPWHYQFLLVAAFLILSVAEGSRLYLGYVGNLQEKVSTVPLPRPKPPCSARDGHSCGYAGRPLAQDPRARRCLFLLDSCRELSREGSAGAGRTWGQGTKGTHSLSCHIPPCAVGATLQHPTISRHGPGTRVPPPQGAPGAERAPQARPGSAPQLSGLCSCRCPSWPGSSSSPS
ncbi:uncharacterized protein LOC141951271 isoform X1 [Strix uralensis]|uniref:uncharacterized protein LOC141951271 isoform X1 n=1 Tax=Strix uralensis TaxID=36305 RepID=UPI003DA73EAF